MSQMKEEEKMEKLRQSFLSERMYYSDRVKALTAKLVDINELNQLQMDLYNEMMDVSLKKSNLVDKLVKLTRQLRNDKKIAFVKSKTDTDIRLKNAEEQSIVIDSELQSILEKQEILDMQIAFLDSTSKIYGNMLWGIKYKIESEQIINGMK